MKFFLSTFVLLGIIKNHLLYNTEYYIQSSNLWIGINIGFRKVNLTLNLEQDETPNGNKIIREPVSWYVKITSERDSVNPYVLQYNGAVINQVKKVNF
ncbi:unnamed protein product [Gordionus sp. m RMFG-2023]